MYTLLQHQLCPLSRYVRLILGEYGLEARLSEEKFWERREDFLLLNPAGAIPVLIEEGAPPVPGATIIGEYLSETRGAGSGDGLFPAAPRERVEVRRLIAWVNEKFHRSEERRVGK